MNTNETNCETTPGEELFNIMNSAAKLVISFHDEVAKGESVRLRSHEDEIAAATKQLLRGDQNSSHGIIFSREDGIKIYMNLISAVTVAGVQVLTGRSSVAEYMVGYSHQLRSWILMAERSLLIQENR